MTIVLIFWVKVYQHRISFVSSPPHRHTTLSRSLHITTSRVGTGRRSLPPRQFGYLTNLSKPTDDESRKDFQAKKKRRIRTTTLCEGSRKEEKSREREKRGGRKAFTLLIFSVSRRPSPNQRSKRRRLETQKLLSLSSFIRSPPIFPLPFFFIISYHPPAGQPAPCTGSVVGSASCCSILLFAPSFSSFLFPILIFMFKERRKKGGGQFVRGLCTHSFPLAVDISPVETITQYPTASSDFLLPTSLPLLSLSAFRVHPAPPFFHPLSPIPKSLSNKDVCIRFPFFLATRRRHRLFNPITILSLSLSLFLSLSLSLSFFLSTPPSFHY